MTLVRNVTSRSSGGFTILELLISSVVLSVIMVPIAFLVATSSRNVKSLDKTREGRLILEQILERVESRDFVTLWDNFGVSPDSPTRLRGVLATDQRNPLLLDRELLARMDELELSGSLEFRFMTRTELGMDPTNALKSTSGILHLQAGIISLKLTGSRVDEFVEKSVYCPAILGRPGLTLSQCPAVNKALREGKFKTFP